MKMFRKLFQNLDIKVVSLLIALLLWAHVVTDRDYESAVPVYLTTSGLRPGLVLVEGPPGEVPVRITAKGRDLIRLHLRRYAPGFKIDLSVLPVGKSPLDLRPEELEIPAGITAKPLRFQTPVPLSVTLDTLVERRIRVQPVLEGDLSDGFTQGGPAVSQPEWVTLKGPKQVLLGLETVPTRPVNLDGRDRSEEERTGLDLSGLRFVRALPETVTVFLTVENMAEKVMERIPVTVIDARHRPGTILEPQVIRLVIQGRSQEMTSLRERSVSASLDVTNLPSGVHVLPARIELPRGFVLKTASPEHFKVVLR